MPPVLRTLTRDSVRRLVGSAQSSSNSELVGVDVDFVALCILCDAATLMHEYAEVAVAARRSRHQHSRAVATMRATRSVRAAGVTVVMLHRVRLLPSLRIGAVLRGRRGPRVRASAVAARAARRRRRRSHPAARLHRPAHWG